MKETLSSFQLSKLAKDRGFNWNCTYSISRDGVESAYDYLGVSHFDQKDIDSAIECTGKQYYLCPTLSLLQKWLRDEHKISVEVWYNSYQQEWNVGSYKFSKLISMFETAYHKYNTYEEALEAGLSKSIDLI